MLRFNSLILLLLSLFIQSSCNKTLNYKKDLSIVKINNVKTTKVSFPKDGYIYVKQGETIYTISNKYRVIPKKIIQANNLQPPYTLKVQQKIFLPYPIVHITKDEDTVFSLSLQYAVNQSDIVELNNLTKPFSLKKIKKIKIPMEKDYSVIGLESKKKILTQEKITKTLSSKSTLNFIWPAKGNLSKKFGYYPDGKQHNDGIDIIVKGDKNVKASSDGKVAFVGSKLRSFGNMILIKHDKVWVTAYAKVGKLFVSEGDVIKKGDIIASMGNSNNILHFQIRKSRNPINPLTLLN